MYVFKLYVDSIKELKKQKMTELMFSNLLTQNISEKFQMRDI